MIDGIEPVTKRSNAEKRNAIKAALLHPHGVILSDRQIGKYVGVDGKTVASIRQELDLTGESPQSSLRTVHRSDQVYQFQVNRSHRSDQLPANIPQ